MNSKTNPDMVRINTRIPKKINEWLDTRSASTGIPKSTLIYLALEQYMHDTIAKNELPQIAELLEQLKEIKTK